MTGKTAKSSIIIALLLAALLPAGRVDAAETISLLVTGNLEGKALPREEGVEKNDPILNLGQSILAERRKNRADLFIDLGNAFYPGALSKYSYGAAMMDFFEYFNCAASLVSSKDLRIGVDNLLFLQSSRNTKLLSANIVREKTAVYNPSFDLQFRSKKISFIGVSSKKIQFDVAEKNVNRTGLADSIESIRGEVERARKRGADYIVLLSGLRAEENVDVLKAFGEIDMVIAGGDNQGNVAGMTSARLDLADGRPIIFTPKKGGYYLLKLRLGKGIRIKSTVHHDIAYYPTADRKYGEFAKRLGIWREKFREEANRRLLDTGTYECRIHDERIASVLRDRFDAEIAILWKGSVNETVLKGEVKNYDMYRLAGDEFPIFTYTIKGSELQQMPFGGREVIADGLVNGKVQGYPIDPKRSYRIASTQSVYDVVAETLNRPIRYDNSWLNLTDIIADDLQNDRLLFQDNYDYLDNRFRATFDFQLSNYIDYLTVSMGRDTETPTGQPTSTYRQWGMENTIVATIYNRYHRLILTPYMNYAELRQENKDYETGTVTTQKFFVSNLLRGTLEYNLTLSPIIGPYHRSQAETVVKKDEDGLRPTIIRETVGARFRVASSDSRASFEGKLGAGFEKKVHDPTDSPVYGLETILNFNWEFVKKLTYSFKLDSFVSKTSHASSGEKGNIRAEITNGLSFSLNSFLSISSKYKIFYYRVQGESDDYLFKQVYTSADLKTDFKLY